MEKRYTTKTRLWDWKKSGSFQRILMVSMQRKSFSLLSNEYFKLIVLAIMLLLASAWHRNANAQVVSPYQLSPKWMFGKQAGMSFPIPPATGSPVNLSGNPNMDAGQEATTTICDTAGNIVLYCNNSKINDGNNVQLQTVNSNNGQSATDGAVVVPDPANPFTQYYLFTGNDLTGGNGGGINWYLIKRNPSTGSLTLISGPTNVAAKTDVMEALCAGTDGAGGYWVVSHTQAGTNQYWAWHVQTTGVTKVISNSSISMGGSYGSVKLSQCQDKITAFSDQGNAEVYTWNKNTGTAGSLLWSSDIGFYGYGCEFSPNGQNAYFTDLQNNLLYQLEIGTGTLNIIAGTGSISTLPGFGGDSNAPNDSPEPEMGTMQLGPDGKIYVTNQEYSASAVPVYIGVINNPNNLGASCNYNGYSYTLNSGASVYPNIYRGIANIAWLSPNTPTIDTSSVGCTYTYTADFKSYFRKQITASVVSWNFGDGTTGSGSPIVHTYTASGTYLVQVSITDATCGQLWTSTAVSVHAHCPTAQPVKYISLSAQQEGSKSIKISWETTNEVNNSYFDVQRSNNGKDFVSVGRVKATLESNYVNQYSTIDNQPFQGTNYYRLVQYDLDGASSLSNIVTAGVAGQVVIKVSPNPSNKDFNVSLDATSEAALEIIDLHGAVLANIDSVQSGKSISVGSSLSPGVYVLKVTVGQSTYFEKIVKQ